MRSVLANVLHITPRYAYMSRRHITQGLNPTYDVWVDIPMRIRTGVEAQTHGRPIVEYRCRIFTTHHLRTHTPRKQEDVLLRWR
jgi:hypothetical protein